MLDTLSLAEHGPVIPVIVLHKVEHAVPLAEALVAGGVKVLEVTLRTAVALRAIEAIDLIQADDNAHGIGRELFAGLRRNVNSAELGACSWV